jgi:hypothetical protein
MRDKWYYAQGAECVGPISQDDLVAILSQVSHAKEVLVWRDGFSDWKPAGVVSELTPHIPNLPARPPPPPPTASTLSDAAVSIDNVIPLQEHSRQNPVQKSRFNNFIARHWRGELPLWVSYWIIAFLAYFAALLFVIIVTGALTADSSYNPISVFLTFSAIWLGVAAITIWQLVGVWRSANKYIAHKATQNKTGAWGGLAKLAVIIGALRAFAYLIQSGYPQIEAAAKIAFMNDPTLPNYALRIMRDGTEVEISGGLKYGVNDDFLRILSAAPLVKVVHLNSNGGRIGEAEKLYQTIKTRNLETYTSSGCYSACTIAFIAGQERWLNPNAKIGFHAPAFPGMSREELLGAAEDQRRLMLAAGIPAPFISRALTTDSSSMWYPSIEELLSANVVTGIADQYKFAVSGFGAVVTEDEFDQQFRKVPLFAAVKKADPRAYAEFIHQFQNGYSAGETEGSLTDALRAKVLPLVRSRLPLAGDQTLLKMGTLVVAQLSALASKDKRLCYEYLYGGNPQQNVAQYLPAELVKQEAALDEQVLLTAEPRADPDPTRINQLWQTIRSHLNTSFGDKAQLLTQKNVPLSQQGDYCDVGIGMYQEIIEAIVRRRSDLTSRNIQTVDTPTRPCLVFPYGCMNARWHCVAPESTYLFSFLSETRPGRPSRAEQTSRVMKCAYRFLRRAPTAISPNLSPATTTTTSDLAMGNLRQSLLRGIEGGRLTYRWSHQNYA